MMRIKSIMSGAVIVTVAIFMITVISNTAVAQSASDSSVGTYSTIKPMSDQEFKALSAQQDAKVNKMISDSVQEQYEKMKANGTIPVWGSTSEHSLERSASVLPAYSMLTITGYANTGNSGSSSWGAVVLPQTNQYASPYSSPPQAGAYSFVNNYGWGGCDSWAWVGYQFTYNGNNGQSIQWGVPISWLGSFVEAGASHGQADIIYCVRDNTPGAERDLPETTVKSWDANMISLSGITGSGNFGGIPFNAQSGHSYTLYVKLKVKSEITGYSLGSMSDWYSSSGGLHIDGPFTTW
jgi:hypothetical protein